jgi:hypothetical protein
VRLTALCTVISATVLACSSDPLTSALGGLVGRWRPQTQALQPRGSMEGLFIVTDHGQTENRVITRGVYPDQGANDLSSHQVLYGRIGTGTDKFVIHPDSLVTQDLFYGPTHRDVQRDFSGWHRDSTSYDIRGNELHLEYYTYPADEPVLTRQILYRVR